MSLDVLATVVLLGHRGGQASKWQVICTADETKSRVKVIVCVEKYSTQTTTPQWGQGGSSMFLLIDVPYYIFWKAHGSGGMVERIRVFKITYEGSWGPLKTLI